ncbi:MAG: HAD family phosphatase [Myxococcota bacterium]
MPAAAAAFFDVDGTLVRINVVHTFAFYAANQPTLLGSAIKYVKTIASVPLLWGMDQLSRKGFNEFFYRYYTGMPEDRLVTLADELFEEVIKPAIFPGSRDLLAKARAAGIRTVLVSGALDFTIRPLAEHLGADDCIANRLEFLGGRATGRMLHPVVAGASKAGIVRDYCARHGLDLAASHAYADSASDYPMLAVVGRPAAVNPDLRLRRLAREFQWPVLDLR